MKKKHQTGPELHKTITRLSTVLAFMASACAAENTPSSPEQAITPDDQEGIFAEFELEIDPTRHTVSLVRDGTATTVSGLGELRLVNDGIGGSGPINSVELETVSTGNGAGACAGFASSFCMTVRLRNFYTHRMQNAFVQLLRITPPANHAVLNSDSGAQFNLSNSLGLWSYGTVNENGGFADHQWVFQDDGVPIHVRGRVFAELLLTSWEVSTNGGASFDPVTLPDAGWNCDFCSRLYRATVPFAPRNISFRWASDNFARLSVNNVVVFDDFYISGFCSDQPCCSLCCDTVGNCNNAINAVPTRLGKNFDPRPTYNNGTNTFLWEAVEESGGDGFHTLMVVTP